MNLVIAGGIDWEGAKLEQSNPVLACYTNPGEREPGCEVSFLLYIATCCPESLYQFTPSTRNGEKTGKFFLKIVELLVSFIFFFILYFFRFYDK